MAGDVDVHPRSPVGQRLLVVILAALAILAVVSSAVAWQRGRNAMQVETISSTVLSASEVSLAFVVTVDPRARVTCQVHAKAVDTSSVGATTVVLEPSD